ncbi:NAD-dependent epimerase/dehydratase family protein [Pseudothioglobus sp. nBUS_23]|uniref:NAD-dependent epimerase/dehydratase family protein n=1 Tax=Pseudothioglobus sp. nBUS_23 TaxID=3395318 RepID=UPI003EBDBC33
MIQLEKKILVTGGAGFIGSHLCEELLKNSNYHVYSLDNYFTGSVKNHINGVNYIRGDTENIDLLVDFQPDVIYHLGEYSRVERSFKDHEIVWNSNILGTFKVLEFVKKTGAKLIYCGSSTKFADSGTGKNQSPYAWTKASNTELVKNYGDWYGISYAITYFYNVYGGREIDEGIYATLIGIFKKQTIKGMPLKVVSPGTQKRNFTHIDDIISGLILVGQKGLGDDFGIGNSDAYCVLDIAQMFGGEIEMIPERKGNRMDAKVISDKTKALGWSASKSIQDYIKEIKL